MIVCDVMRITTTKSQLYKLIGESGVCVCYVRLLRDVDTTQCLHYTRRDRLPVLSFTYDKVHGNKGRDLDNFHNTYSEIFDILNE